MSLMQLPFQLVQCYSTFIVFYFHLTKIALATISFAPFTVDEAKAKEIFNDWKEGRWYFSSPHFNDFFQFVHPNRYCYRFAPADFGELRQGELYGFLVPYFVFNATILAKYGFAFLAFMISSRGS
jgi:hypothetical protein